MEPALTEAIDIRELHRGQWRVSDTRDGFVLTVRPGIGPLSLWSGLFLAAFGSVCLVYVAFAVRLLGEGELQPFLWFGLVPLFFAFFAGVGSYFLAYGGYRLTVTGDELVFEYPGNLSARRYRLNRSNLKSVDFDERWIFLGMYWGYNAGHMPFRGPVRFRRARGSAVNFGGNLPKATALDIIETLNSRLSLDQQGSA